MGKNRGFTLVEIAIVLVIVAMIIGAILTVTPMRRNIQIKQMMDDISRLSQGYAQFADIYKGVPGDLFNATTKLGPSTSNGNGNGLIDSASEQSLAFHHLSLAGLTKRAYTSTWASDVATESTIDRAKYYFWYAPVWSAATTTNYINIATASDVDTNGTINGNTEAYRAILSPQEMRNLDSKYDDGTPTSGMVVATEGYGQAANACVNGGTYVATSNVTCIFAIAVDKKF